MVCAPENSSFWLTSKNDVNTDIPSISPQNGYFAAQILCPMSETVCGHDGVLTSTSCTPGRVQLANINQYGHTLWKMTSCKKVVPVSPVKMFRAEGTVGRVLSSLQGAETSSTCHANHSQPAHASASGVGCCNSARGDKKIPGSGPDFFWGGDRTVSC